MGTARDVAFGRLVVAQGLVPQEAVRLAYQQLAPGRALRDELVARRLLAPDRAAALDAWLAQQERPAPPADDGATVRLSSAAGPPADDGATVRPTSASGSFAARLPEVGERVAGFDLVRLLGKGGMGAVFEARDARTGERYALKVLLSAEDAGALARFRREAEALAKVDAHAGIIRVRGLGEHAGLTYALMDLVIGRDLHRLVKEDGPLEVARALRYTEAVARAVHHCHGKGVLHRDLKPANVLLREEDDAPLVMDFGLARDRDAERLTRTGDVLGTPAYMAPEQAEGDRDAVDARTDVYALGAILYELVTGRAPFSGSQMEILKKVFLDQPAPLRSLRPDADEDLETVCKRAMAKDRALRYESAAAFADDLGRLAREEPIAARAPTLLEDLSWRLRRRDARAWVALGAAIVGVVALIAAPAVLLLKPRGAAEGLRALLPSVREVVAAEGPLDPSARAWELVKELSELVPAEAPDVARVSSLAALAAPEPLSQVLREEPAGRAALVALARRTSLARGAGDPGGELPGPEGALLTALGLLRWSQEAAGPVDVEGARALLAQAAQATGPTAVAAERVQAALDAVPLAVQAELAARTQALLAWAADGVSRGSGAQPWTDVAPAVVARLGADGPRLRSCVHAALDAHKADALAAALDELARAWRTSRTVRWSELRTYEAIGALLTGPLQTFVREPPAVAPGHPRLSEAARDLVVVVTKNAQGAPGSCQVTAFQLFPRLRGIIADLDAQAFRREAFDTIAQGVAALLERGAAPRPEQLMLLPALHRLPTLEGLLPVLRPLLDSGAIEREVLATRTGDAYLVWAELTARVKDELESSKGPDGKVRKPTREDVATIRWLRDTLAAALGPRLDPAERVALELPAAVPLEAPLTSFWAPRARCYVAIYTYRIEMKRADRAPSRALIERALAVLRDLRRRDDLFEDPTVQQKVIHEEADVLAELYFEGARDDPRWQEQLLPELELSLEAEIEVGQRIARDYATGKLREGYEEGSAGAADARMDEDHMGHFLEEPVEELALLLETTGRAARARELLAASIRAHQEISRDLPFPFALHGQHGRLLLAAGALDEAEAVLSAAVEEARRRPGAVAKQREQRAKMRSAARALLAQVALARGDEAAARALLEAARREGDPMEADLEDRGRPWRPVLERLGER